MSLIDDPDMKEVVVEFCEESKGLFKECRTCLESWEDDPENGAHLEKFGQVIDRVMGAAQTIQLDSISVFCEFGKKIGYKASQVKELPLLEVCVGVLFDVMDTLDKMIKNIEEGKSEGAGIDTEAFHSRLKWLASKFSHVKRSSVAVSEEDEDVKKKAA